MQTDSFIADFEIIRKIMHLILKYGTLTPQSMADKSGSISQYNKMKALLIPVLGNTIEDRRYQGHKKLSLHITADQFSEDFSSICNLCLVKSVKVNEFVSRMLILQLLNHTPDLTTNQLLDHISSFDGFSEGIHTGTFSNYLKHLETYGQICKTQPQKPYHWALQSNLLQKLSDRQLCDLLLFTDFMRRLQEPGICGEQLYRSIIDIDNTAESSPFLSKICV